MFKRNPRAAYRPRSASIAISSRASLSTNSRAVGRRSGSFANIVATRRQTSIGVPGRSERNSGAV